MTQLTQATFEKVRNQIINTGLLTEPVIAKEISFALQIINGNPKLAETTNESKLQSVMNVANIGLSLNPALKEAYLLPRWDYRTKTTLCCLEPSYQGLIKLLTDTGSVKSVEAQLVREGELFECELGTSPKIKHQKNFGSGKNSIVGVYAVAILHDGRKQVEMMDKSELDEIKSMSESFKAFTDGKIKDCVWVQHEGEMCRKTVLRRITKYLPKTDQWDKVATAIQLDESDYKASHGKQDYIESLLANSNFSEDKKQLYEGLVPDMSNVEANNLIADLKDNQLDPIQSGNNYTQTDILKKLNKL